MRLANQRFCFSWGSDQRLAFTQETHLPKTGTPANAAQPQQAANLLSLSSCLLQPLQQPHQPEVQLSKHAALPNSGFALAGVRDYFRAFRVSRTRTPAKANEQLKPGDERTRHLPEARHAAIYTRPGLRSAPGDHQIRQRPAVVKRETLGALHNGRGIIHRRGGFAGQFVTAEVLHNARIGGGESGRAAGGRTVFT